MAQPNPLAVVFGILKALLTVRRPDPRGPSTFDHSMLTPVLDNVAVKGIPGAVEQEVALEAYLGAASLIDPDQLTWHDALAYWINVYNAGAIRLAVEAWDDGLSSVLRVPGGFSSSVVEIAGESLSLDAIEHAKIRRFGDPRIHGALVCGSLSCPTLSATPFEGEDLDERLDVQMRLFLAGGGAVVDEDETLQLSRIFLWYGGDFVWPNRMPTFIPVNQTRILSAIERWLPDDTGSATSVEYQSYNWGLACNVA